MTPLLLAALGVAMGGIVGAAAGRGWALAQLDLAELRRHQAAEAGARSADEAWRYAAGVDAELCRVRALLQAAEVDLVEAHRREMDGELAELGAAFVEEFASAGAAVVDGDRAAVNVVQVDISPDDMRRYRLEIAASLPDAWEGAGSMLKRGMAYVAVGMEMMAVGGAAMSSMEDWGEDAIEAALDRMKKLEARLAAGEPVPFVREAQGFAPDEAAVEAELVEIRAEQDDETDGGAEIEGLWAEAEAAWAPRAPRAKRRA